MITFLVTLKNSIQFEVKGMSWLCVANEAEFIRHRDYFSVPIFSVVAL